MFLNAKLIKHKYPTFPGTGVLSKYAGGIFVTQDYKKREFFVSGKKSIGISTVEKTPPVSSASFNKTRKSFYLKLMILGG